MLHNVPSDALTLGADIRALRKARGFTLTGLAAAVGKSVGWLSQVERGMSDPSINDLRELAARLDVSVSSLFRTKAADGEEGYVVRHNARRPIGSREDGLVEELLSPDLTDDFEMVHSTFQPRSEMAKPVSRPTQEVGYILSGRLSLKIGDTLFQLHPGDSFRIRGETYHWSNPHNEPCIAIWAIAPPVY